ncbi:hypothetical protein [Salmonella enterica]|uniref:hypothetical protein n=1 Tax=Salmonella enterica TaxID=28901 RepID=UPI003F745641
MAPLMLGTWHQALIDSLKQITWVKDADEYPEKITQLVTPAVFVDVPGWDKGVFPDGQTRVTLKCDLFVVTDRAGNTENVPKPQIYARCLAMDLSDWVDGATFGLDNVDPAIFIDAEVDTFDRMLDDYIVFRVSFEQDILVGEDPFAVPSGAPLQEVWLGKAPEVGRKHIDDYRLIYRAGWAKNESGG